MASEGHLMRSAHISHHRGAVCPFSSACPAGTMSLNRDSVPAWHIHANTPGPPGRAYGARNCDQAGGHRREGPGLVALRPRVPGLARVARCRGPALCATAEVKPTEGGAGQGHGGPSRPDPNGRGAPVTGLFPRRILSLRCCAPVHFPHVFLMPRWHQPSRGSHRSQQSHRPGTGRADPPQQPACGRGATAAPRSGAMPIASLGNAGLGVKATGILCNGGQSSMHNQ